jgi:uncharacterized phage protein (TIGR02218 family)
MKNISTALKSHIGGEVITLATCWKIVRKDGVIMGFTSHDKNLVISDLTYFAETGISPTAVQTTASFAVDNLEVEGMLSSSAISEADINAGLYDFAELEIFIVNYTDLSAGKLQLRRGWLGEITFGKNQFVAEVRGLAQKLSQRIGDVFSPLCRASFADAKCGKSAGAYTFSASVTAAESQQIFIASSLTQAAGYFNFGKITFTSGANLGLSMEVKEFASGKVILVLPLPYAIDNGDNFSIIAGCDKNFDTCKTKFLNAINFRGEPHVPGADKALETAGTFTRV